VPTVRPGQCRIEPLCAGAAGSFSGGRYGGLVCINHPHTIRKEFASEAQFAARRPFYATEARDVALRELAAGRPLNVLEIGCGWGDFAARIPSEVGAEVVAIDLSPRMVELARQRGVRAELADAQALPFSDRAFDCVVALWMLYHLPDIDRGLREVVRVLRPDGRLIAVIDGYDHLAELWDRVGPGGRVALPFSRENGTEILSHHFATVERHDVEAEVVFDDHATARRYIASTITRRALVKRLPEFSGPLRATCATSLFVATRS
jgi:ubiquinone/menaquinone biosynthesis C-methylase UbiE